MWPIKAEVTPNGDSVGESSQKSPENFKLQESCRNFPRYILGGMRTHLIALIYMALRALDIQSYLLRKVFGCLRLEFFGSFVLACSYKIWTFTSAKKWIRAGHSIGNHNHAFPEALLQNEILVTYFLLQKYSPQISWSFLLAPKSRQLGNSYFPVRSERRFPWLAEPLGPWSWDFLGWNLIIKVADLSFGDTLPENEHALFFASDFCLVFRTFLLRIAGSFRKCTIPETNIAPENWCLEDEVPFWMAFFQVPEEKIRTCKEK